MRAQLLTAREAAAWLQTSLPNLYRLVREGRVPALRLRPRGHLRFDQAALDGAFLLTGPPRQPAESAS